MQSRAAISTTLLLPVGLARRIAETAGWIVAESVRRHRAFVAVVVAYCVACLAASWLVGGGAAVDVRPYTPLFGIFLLALIVVALLGGVVYVMIWVRPEGSLYPAIGQFLAGRILSADRLANAFVPIVVGPMFFNAFGSFKRLIPLINPYGWDETFMRWDAWLHGGTQPWELLQPVLGAPHITSGVNFFYNFWLALMFGTFIWQACTLKRPALRMQFLLSFLIFWIVLGTVLATAFASVGPCYYGRFTGLADPYEPLMTYLRAANEVAPVWSLKVQEMLWQNYVEGGTMLGSGISAMPSMHLAISALMTLLAWRVNRWLGIAFAAFTAIILVGSVHLGWHYAIDGYVSIIAAIPLWYAAGWAVRRLGQGAADPRPAPAPEAA